MSQPTPKFLPLNAKKTTNQLLVLKDRGNTENKTPQNSRFLKSSIPQKASNFENLLNENAKSASKSKNNAVYHTPVHCSVSRLATTPHQTSHYESHLTNSAILKRTQGSSVKKPQIQSAKLPQKTAVYNHHVPVMNTTVTVSKPAFDINPVVNGVDYSDMIARKAELGYSGPGYIVEFNCDPKYIRGIIIQKGLWKLTTDTNYEPDKNCTDIGPAMYFHRMDKQERLTPGRTLTNYEFNWRPRFVQSDEKIFHDTTQNLDLETQPKAKKALKWASNLEDVKENSFKLSPQVTRPAATTNATSSPIHSAEIKRKLRRSFSHNEILGLTNAAYSSKHDDYSLNLPAYPKFDLNDLSVTTVDENKENTTGGTSAAGNNLADSGSSHGLNLSEINSIKNDSQSSLTNTTAVTDDLNSVLKEVQTMTETLKRLNESELNLKSNSTLEILKMTNAFSLMQDYCQKFKDKILINSFSK